MRYLRFLQRLLPGKGRRHHRDHDQKDPSAAGILQLPLDILFLITDQLALHDKFLLSHTCKGLQQVVFQHQGWAIEVSRLSFEDQIRFWAGLAYTLPNRWVCLKCCKLHLIDTSDHYHVQFALKLSRLGVHRRYLKALMKTYKNTWGSLIPPLTESYTAEPRIINKRFVLREEWEISNNTSRALSIFLDERDLVPSVCPHMEMRYGGPATSRLWKQSSIYQMAHMPNNNTMRQLDQLLKEATLLEGQWIFNSCLHCSTDFAIIISTDKQEAIIQAWHDFGIEVSPIDIYWKAHVVDRNTYWFELGPYIDYPHGSIQNLWLEGAS
ncbi:hypothetical protein V8C35DRAFT_328980 [Trichoderma chlorosporum]